MREPESLSTEELLCALKRLVQEERERLVPILRHLAAADTRDAAVERAFPSLFAYCVEELRYSEGEAYRRIHAARAARDFPVICSMIRRSEISLTIVSLLAPHLCRENYSALLKQAAGKTRREVERLVASLDPKPEPIERIRHLGPRAAVRAMGGSGLFDRTPAPADEPKSPRTPIERRVQFSFTADERLLAMVERARDLLRHKYPAGRLEDILGDAVNALLEKKDPDRRIARRERRKQARAKSGTPAARGSN